MRPHGVSESIRKKVLDEKAPMSSTNPTKTSVSTSSSKPVHNEPKRPEGQSSQTPADRMLDAAKHPLYRGCREGHTPLSVAAEVMRIKLDHNLSEDCVDALLNFMKDILPKDNICPSSYCEIELLLNQFPEFYPDRHDPEAA